MMYKLEPIVEKIISTVELNFPDGKQKHYANGSGVAADSFEQLYIIKSIYAKDNKTVIVLEAAKTQDMESCF